jgi:dihydroorotase
MKVLFKNAHLLDPSTGRDEISDMLIVDGIVEQIKTKLGTSAQTEVYDLKGAIVAPGFIDMHVHAREPGFEHKETVATAMMAAAAGGFTAICCMPNTNPPIDDASVVELVKRKSKEVMPQLVDVYPIGAVTKGREGQELSPMAELAQAGVVAFSDDGSPVASAAIMRRALEYASMLGKPIIQHAEESSLMKGGVVNEGTVSTHLGLPAIPAIAEEIIVARDITLVEYLVNGQGKPHDTHHSSLGIHYHVAHVSTAGAVQLVRQAKKRKLPVTCEATPHHFTLTDNAVLSFDTNTKMNPPLRTQDDVKAIKEGLRDGTIDVIASDHAPHSYDEKQVEYSQAPFGIVGLETALGLAITELVIPKTITLLQLVEKFAVNPRKILHLPIPILVEGKEANLTMFDPQVEWTVDVSKFHSKSKNSPFHGRKLVGKTVAMFNHGSLHFC